MVSTDRKSRPERIAPVIPTSSSRCPRSPFRLLPVRGSFLATIDQRGQAMPGVIDSPTAASGFRPLSLDALNFLLADVLGPYLNVFLVTQQHWSQSEVGLVTTIGGLLVLVVKTPVGAAIDATRAKRGLVIAALGVLAVGATVIAAAPSFWPVVIANSVIAMVGDVFGPAIAALTLGLYVREHLARRMGRNAAFDHAGNVAIAVVAGAVGWAVSQRA